MRDYKSAKPNKVKGNRLKRQKQARDWRQIFQRALGIGLLLGKCALALLLVGGAFLAGRTIFHSGYFGVGSIRVENLNRLSEDDVVGLSDIHPGVNIFDLDLEAIGRKIAEDPWVATAEVRRVFPREVVIRVRERQPRAIVHLGYLYYVDDEGEVFKVLAATDSLDFPAITGLKRNFLLENPEKGRRLLKEAVGLLRQLGKRRIFTTPQVSELHIDTEDGLSLYTMDGGVPVHLGFTGFGAKLDRLERIYPKLQGRLAALKSIDLNVADRVIVKVDRGPSGKG
jgi:cell division protein FtsQ